MKVEQESIIPAHANDLLKKARARAGEYNPGHQVKVEFSGAFHDGEGFEERLDMQDGKLRRRRNFTTIFPADVAEQFLQQPSLELIFDQYGLSLDWLVVLEVDNIIIEQIPPETAPESTNALLYPPPNRACYICGKRAWQWNQATGAYECQGNLTTHEEYHAWHRTAFPCFIVRLMPQIWQLPKKWENVACLEVVCLLLPGPQFRRTKKGGENRTRLHILPSFLTSLPADQKEPE